MTTPVQRRTFHPFAEILRLRPASLTDERLLEAVSLSGKARYDYVRYVVGGKPTQAQVNEQVVRALTVAEDAEAQYLKVIDAEGKGVVIHMPAQIAERRLCPQPPEAERVFERLERRRDPHLRDTLNTIFDCVPVVWHLEDLAAQERWSETAEVAWWASMRSTEPSIAAAAAALWPRIARHFGAAPPERAPDRTRADDLWTATLEPLRAALAPLPLTFDEASLTVLDSAVINVVKTGYAPDLGVVLNEQESRRLALALLAEELGEEGAAALAPFGTDAVLRWEMITSLALAYGVLGLHQEGLRKDVEERRQTLKAAAAKALEAEDFATVQRLGGEIAALQPATAPRTYLERLATLAAFAQVWTAPVPAAAQDAEPVSAEPETTAAGTAAATAALDETKGFDGEPASSAASADAEHVALLEAEVADLTAQRDAAEAEAKRQAEAARRAHAEIARLRQQSGAPAAAPVEPVARPRTLPEIPAWSERVHAGRLVLTPRAQRMLGRTVFQDVDLVVDVLDLLAAEYRDAKMPGNGGGDAKAALDARLAALNVDIARSVTPSSPMNRDPQLWANLDGDRLFLDMHVRRGKQHDPRILFRCYFTFDDERQMVVVGWLPEHVRDANT